MALPSLATPLFDVVFGVIDLETTGAAPSVAAVTEIGAARFRGGERIGTFQTLVNPGVPVPPFISVLTGITTEMVTPALPVDDVIPSLVSFLRLDTPCPDVIVGHNVRFDLSFLAAAGALVPTTARVVDTCRLARRLVADEVANCRLHTLAGRFGLDHQPTHRAMPDVLATADLLHFLLERAATWGVRTLGDLLEFPPVHRHPYAAKLHWTRRLPRGPGVYLLRAAHGEVLYAGMAPDICRAVRLHFLERHPRRDRALVRQLGSIETEVHTSMRDAALRHAQLIALHRPRFNSNPLGRRKRQQDRGDDCREMR